MVSRLHRLLVILAAPILIGSGTGVAADGTATDSVAPFGVLANTTISCSVAAPSWTVGCFAERPMFILGGFEVAVGVDAQTTLSNAAESHLAPYGILAYYAPTWSAWLEVALPGNRIPIIGRPDYVRVGFTYRIQ